MHLPSGHSKIALAFVLQLNWLRNVPLVFSYIELLRYRLVIFKCEPGAMGVPVNANSVGHKISRGPALCLSHPVITTLGLMCVLYRL